MYGAGDLIVTAVGWVLVIEVPLACCCADRANVLDCVCHGVLSGLVDECCGYDAAEDASAKREAGNVQVAAFNLGTGCT